MSKGSHFDTVSTSSSRYGSSCLISLTKLIKTVHDETVITQKIFEVSLQAGKEHDAPHVASGVRDISGGCNDSPPGPGSQECTTSCRKGAANPYQSPTAPKMSSRTTSIASSGVGTATDKNHKRNQDSRSPPTLAPRRPRSCSESANDRVLLHTLTPISAILSISQRVYPLFCQRKQGALILPFQYPRGSGLTSSRVHAYRLRFSSSER